MNDRLKETEDMAKVWYLNHLRNQQSLSCAEVAKEKVATVRSCSTCKYYSRVDGQIVPGALSLHLCLHPQVAKKYVHPVEGPVQQIVECVDAIETCKHMLWMPTFFSQIRQWLFGNR
jgi:hypothetical protein